MKQIRNTEISEVISSAAFVINVLQSDDLNLEKWIDYYDCLDLAITKWSKPNPWTLAHEYIEAVYLEDQNYILDKHFPGTVIQEICNILDAYEVDYSSISTNDPVEIYDDGCGNDAAEEYAEKMQKFFVDNYIKQFIDEVFTVLYSNKNFLFEFNKQSADIIISLKKADYPNLLKEDGVFKRINRVPEWLKNGVRLRDKERCSQCGTNLGRVLLNDIQANYDHIIPLQKHGNNDPTNWQLTCETCNKSKGDRNSAFKNVFSSYWRMSK